MTDVLTGAPPDSPPGERRPRRLGAALLVLGGLGLVAAFVLTVEKIALIRDPTYIPTCSVNPLLSCGSVMSTPQAELLGFPNSLLGVVGFTVVAATGAALLSGAVLARWYWAGLQLGVTAAVVFVHWLVFQSAFRIGALCPYCMVIWAVTIPVFVLVTLHVAASALPPGGSRARTVVEAVASYRSLLLTSWFLLIAATLYLRFG